MTYCIARNGELYGPYAASEVQRHLASGHILPTDLIQPIEAQEWVPVESVFPSPPAARTLPGGLSTLYPNPPDLPWWVALLLGLFTLGFFFQIWDIVQSAWMRGVNRSSVAIYLYAAEFIVYLVKLPYTWHTVAYNMFNGPRYDDPTPIWLTVTSLALLVASRFVLRRELLRHFNVAEPLGLRLNWLLTLIFGGLYFQYHFNHLNQLKRTLGLMA